MTSLADVDSALASADAAAARSDLDAVIAHLSTAVRACTAAADHRRAAMACARLGDVYANGLGNQTVARAWFARAERLLADEPPCLEQGWVAVASMGCHLGDPDDLLRRAELALDRARRFGDLNLEAKALADGGLAHVQAGRLDEGFALLDEAMALVCGPADDVDTAGRSVCSFFTACYHAADFDRAGSWADLLRQHGLIGTQAGSPAFVAAHCDSVQATLLVELGRWREAEAVLERSCATFAEVMGVGAWHPAIALADLRIRQGRLAEAEALLVGKDQAFDALLPAARLHLARGDHALARAVTRRGLRALGADRLRATELLTVAVEAALLADDLPGAEAALAELAERAGPLDVPVVRGRLASTRARVLVAAGDRDAAATELEAGLAAVEAHALPWRRASLLLELAAVRDAQGDPAEARAHATGAGAILDGLDVVVPDAARRLLEQLGSVADPAPSRAGTAILRPEGRWWVVAWDGTSVRLPTTKGLRYLAELVARPGVEQHALDLVDRIEGVAADGGVDRHRLGDAGPLVDGRARAAYRQRIEALRADADEAVAAGRLDQAEALAGEIDQLVGQLARAFGLGGRERRAASAAERARLNVTRALRAAIAKITDALSEAGAALDRGVRTGTFCRYDPAEGDVRWIVQP